MKHTVTLKPHPTERIVSIRRHQLTGWHIIDQHALIFNRIQCFPGNHGEHGAVNVGQNYLAAKAIDRTLLRFFVLVRDHVNLRKHRV